MDILLSEKEKKLVRLTVFLLRKKLGECGTVSSMHDDLTMCGNSAIKEIARIVNEVSDEISEDFQRNTVRELSELGLWICYKDTAFRDVFFYLLDKILANAKIIRVLIHPYVKPPNKWTVNAWHEAKKISAAEQASGKLGKGVPSTAEEIFTPKKQTKVLSEMLYHMKNRGEV